MSSSLHLFHTTRFTVRRFSASESDSEDFFRFNGCPEATRFIRPAKAREECDLFLVENLELYTKQEKDQPCHVGRMHVSLKSTGEFVGVFSLLFLNSGDAAETEPKAVHIGFGFIPPFWNRGYATELLKFGTAFFFQETSYPSIFAITDPENVASEIVLGKNGYMLTGSFGSSGLHLFRLNRSDYLERLS